MTYEDILVEYKDGIAIVTLNRPEVLNALSMAMRKEIGTAFLSFKDNDEVKAVVLTGAGRAFCAGGDLNFFHKLKDPAQKATVFSHMRRSVTSIRELEKPVIGMINGPAAGAGCNIALLTDIIIASDKAFFSESFVKIGLAPDWAGAYLLTRLIGMHKAKEMAFTGMRLPAEEALKIGLINRVVPHDRLEQETMTLARQMAEGPTKALGSIKKLIQKAWLVDMSSLLDYEAFINYQLLETDDHDEGVKAFLEKRDPVFTGK